mgnify:CR=1 FL=1|tara:strand:+ start:995 stop:2092 length:1098 start_codon:yes stop_codon:yes gene_type:complete
MNTNQQQKVKYDLSKLNNNYNELNKKTIDNINVCIYTIIKSDNITNIVAPFLCFLLYKYDNNIKNLSEYFVFPFKKYKNLQNKKMKDAADDLVYNCTNNKLKCKGYIYENKNVYFFYESLEKYNLEVINRKNKLWWVVLDEICNHKKAINFPIHKSVYTLFYNNPHLLYLKDNINDDIEIPSVVYYGAPWELIPYNAALGQRQNAKRDFGSFFYFGDYLQAIKDGCWTRNKRQYKSFYHNIISDKDGKFYKGGLIRSIVFLGNSRCILYRPTDPFHWYINNYDSNKKKPSDHDERVGKYKGAWAKDYDSLVLSNIKFKNLSGYFHTNTEYIIKTSKQIYNLSSHKIDMKTILSNWDPFYSNYFIK